MGFFLIRLPVKVRKLHYFVILHDFSDLQWLRSKFPYRNIFFMVSISLRITPLADHPLLVGATIFCYLEGIHMNNTVAIICSKMQNLN